MCARDRRQGNTHFQSRTTEKKYLKIFLAADWLPAASSWSSSGAQSTEPPTQACAPTGNPNKNGTSEFVEQHPPTTPHQPGHNLNFLKF